MEQRENCGALSPRLEALSRAYSEEMETPTGDDRVIAAYAEAAMQEIHSDFGRLLDSAFDFRDTYKHPIDAHHAVQLTLRVLQRQMLKHYPHTYPMDFFTPEAWREKINELIGNPDIASDIEGDLIIREVQSNVVERYKAFKLIGHMYRDRIGDNPEILDVGCSLNLGLKKLAIDGRYPFGRIEVGSPGGEGFISDEQLTDAANILLASRLAIGASMGVDVFISHNNDNADTKEWVRACSFYPRELLKPALLMEFNDLQSETGGTTGYYTGDFSNSAEMENLHIHFSQLKWEAEHPEYKSSHESLMELIERLHGPHPDEEIFDMVTFSTSMYLMSWHERIRALKRAKRLVKPTGLIVIQDFAEQVPLGKTKLRFHNNFHYDSMPYRTYALDPRAPELDPQHIFSWETGRCQRLRLGLGKIAVSGKARAPQELLSSRL
ncbi:class I SAM-dependent methyltransferase [Candidatus Saccharibacteria bacterium]|nr:class I SAM-dependent methyltransferase [Candidatus Saccharibacteria bacterium]